jgi:MFS family permease
MRSVLKRPDFRRLFSGLFFSMTAESILLLALAIWAKDLTGSDGLAGAAILAVVAPMVFAPLIGFIVDRFRRKPFLVTVLLLSAVLLTPLFLVKDRGDLWIIYAVGFGYGISVISVSGALNGLIKIVIPEAELAQANAALQTVKQGLRLVAPLIGAGLYVVTKGWGLAVVGMAGFVVAATIISMMKVRESAPVRSELQWGAEVAAGVRHLMHTVSLRHTVFGVMAAILVFGFSESVFFAFNDQGLHKPPAFLAVIICVEGVGGLLGGLTAARVVRTVGEIGTVALGVALFLPVLVTSLWPSLWLVFPTSVLTGLGLPYCIVGINTLMQRVTPSALMGRVSAATEALISGPQALSIAVGAVLVEQLPFRVLFVIMAVVSAASSLYLWTKRGLSEPSQLVQPVQDQAVGDGAAVGQTEVA